MKSVFVSFGGPDEAFARRLADALSRIGVELFLFTKHARPGERLHHVMRDGVNKFDKVILICSRDSLIRPGVLNEIEETLQREAREGGRTILIPITLDNYVFREWTPDRPGLAQAIRDRVVADFRSVRRNNRKFWDALAPIVDVLTEEGDEDLIEYVSGRYVVEIKDSVGRFAQCKYERTVIARSDGVRRLLLRDFSASGQFEYTGTNMGRLVGPYDEGGRQYSYIEFDTALPQGEAVTVQVNLLATDCYLEPTEATTLTVSNNYQLLGIEVTVPSERTILVARAWRLVKGRKTAQPGLLTLSGQTVLRLLVREPLLSATYGVEWDW